MNTEDLIRRRWELPVRARHSQATMLVEPLVIYTWSAVAWQAPSLQDVADKMLLPLNDWPLRMMRVYTNILKKPRLGGAQRPSVTRNPSLRVICDSVHTAGVYSPPAAAAHHDADEQPDPNLVHPAHRGSVEPAAFLSD